MKRIDSSLFGYHNYDAELIPYDAYLNKAEMIRVIQSLNIIGYSKSHDIPMRPREDGYAMMAIDETGNECWCHIDERIKLLIEGTIID